MASQEIALGTGIFEGGFFPARVWNINASLDGDLSSTSGVTITQVVASSLNELRITVSGGQFSDALEGNVAGIGIRGAAGDPHYVSGSSVDSSPPYSYISTGLWTYVNGRSGQSFTLFLDNGVSFSVRLGDVEYTRVFLGDVEYTAVYLGDTEYSG